MSYVKRSQAKRRGLRSKIWEAANRPPQDDTWMFVPLEMLKSFAWVAAPPEVKLAVVRLLQEHHEHGGHENGNLIVTYDQFERFGIQRRKIKWSLRAATALGFLDVVDNGGVYGDIARSARYRLTFRPSVEDGQEQLPSNRWKRFRSVEEAYLALPAKPRAPAPRAELTKNASVRVKLVQ